MRTRSTALFAMNSTNKVAAWNIGRTVSIINTHTVSKRDRQTDRQTEKDRETERQRNIQTDN